MLNIFARASVSRVIDPLGARLVRAGLTPNAMTIVGTVGAIASALWFIPHGGLFTGALLVTVFVLFDLLDGAMARTSGTVTRFGTVLDASCDRLADGALFGAVTWWALVDAHDRLVGATALVCLVTAQVISYIKARADATGLSADGGLVERAERFIVALLGIGLEGLGVPYAARVAFPLLAALSVITVGQRLAAVARSARQQETPATGDGQEARE